MDNSCDALIVNLTPFHSPSTDPSAAFEIGFMRALGRLVMVYTKVEGTLIEGTGRYCGGLLRPRKRNTDPLLD